jgi:excisionase family DNA binding protein
MMTTMLLRPNEVAIRLALSPATVRRWIFDGRLPVVKLGRAVRVRETDVEALIRMGSVPLRGGQ